MALLKSKHALGTVPVVSLTSALVAGMLREYATEGALAANDIIDLGPIEAGMSLVDCALIADDLDTGGSPAVTLSVGLLNAGKTDLDTTFIAAATVGQAGGVARATTAATYLAGASNVERRLGVKVVAAPATNAAVGKKIAVLLLARG
jgi:hypothetical protein